MTRKKRMLTAAGGAALVVFVGVWIAGEVMINRVDPPERYSGVILSSEADPILRRACFDCHSNETEFPKYSYLPVVSLLLADHVNEGRSEFNFSEWGKAEKDDQKDTIEDSLIEAEDGDMPPWSYRLMHPEARLTAQDLAVLKQGALQAYGITEDTLRAKRRERKRD